MQRLPGIVASGRNRTRRRRLPDARQGGSGNACRSKTCRSGEAGAIETARKVGYRARANGRTGREEIIGHSSERMQAVSGDEALAEELSEERSGRDRPPTGQIASATCWSDACRRYADRPAFACMGKSMSYGELDAKSAAFGGLAAVEGARQGRARRHHDAERAAISGGDDGHPARRLHRRERQPALHAARTGAPAEGFRRRGDRHPRELRHDAAGGDCARRRSSTSSWPPWATCSASRVCSSTSSCGG